MSIEVFSNPKYLVTIANLLLPRLQETDEAKREGALRILEIALKKCSVSKDVKEASQIILKPLTGFSLSINIPHLIE